jgi:methylglutaconyl-CoA hydratase
VTADRAREAGLLTAVAPDEELDTVVDGYVASLRQGAPGAIAATKELLRRVPTMSAEDGFAWTADLSAALFAGEEAAAGMAAFLFRTPPPWAAVPDPV